MPTGAISEFIRTYWPIAVGVAGLIGGAIGFVLNDVPMLASRVDGSSTLGWFDTVSPGVCRAQFKVNFTNIGKSGFSVRKIRVRAWILDESTSIEGRGSFIDTPRLLSKMNPLNDTEYTESNARKPTEVNSPLLGVYYAGMSYHTTFEWNIARNPQTNFFVYVELFPSASDTETPWHFGEWSHTCG